MAASSSVTIRLNVKTLLVILLLTVPPLLIDLFLVLDRGRSDLVSMAGDYFEALAENTASQVSRFVDARVADVRVLTALEPVREAAAASQSMGRSQSLTDQAAELAEVNRKWESPEVAPLVSRIMGNQTSIQLRDYLDLNTAFERILVTDSHGIAVAASHKPIRYYYGEQRWWIRSFGDGESGHVHVADVEWDPVSLSHCIAIAYPILGPEGHEVLGVVRAFMNVAQFEPLIRTLRLGGSGEAKLVKRDGTAIMTRDPSPSLREKAEEMEIVSPKLAETVRGHSIVRLRGGGEVFAGYAELTLAQKYPEIDWAVLVTQNFDEVSAPIETINSRALGSAFLAILIVAALAIYFTTHRPQEIDDMNELLSSQQGQSPRVRSGR